MDRYIVTAVHSNGTTEVKILDLPSCFEEAECEAECYFTDVKYLELERLNG